MWRVVLLTILLVSWCPLVRGDIIYPFVNGGILDGDTAGSTAIFPADSVTGTMGTITTLSVTGGVLNENSNSLGVNDSVFDTGESWQFSWDVWSRLDFIDCSSFTLSETFSISSSGWTGRSFTISDSNLSFSGSTFTFDAGSGSDTFDLLTIVTGDSLEVAPGVSYTFSPGAGTSTSLASMSFTASVPEVPASIFLISGFCFLAMRHWFKWNLCQWNLLVNSHHNSRSAILK